MGARASSSVYSQPTRVGLGGSTSERPLSTDLVDANGGSMAIRTAKRIASNKADLNWFDAFN
jgi:hypothetical protein